MGSRTSDVERGREVSEPLIGTAAEENVGMVVFSTIVAVCGSYSFGTCVSFCFSTLYYLIRNFSLPDYYGQ